MGFGDYDFHEHLIYTALDITLNPITWSEYNYYSVASLLTQNLIIVVTILGLFISYIKFQKIVFIFALFPGYTLATFVSNILILSIWGHGSQ